MRSRAPLSPMPGAPGMLSMASPLSASRSATWEGFTPKYASTLAGSYHSSSFMGLSMKTRSLTSWSMSLSLETITRGDGADDVVGLIAGEFEHRDAHGVEEAADVRDLFGEILRHFRTVGFVVSEAFRAEGRSGAFEDGGDVFGLVAGHELAEHIVKDVNGLCGQAGAGAHGRGSAAGAGVIGPEDEAEGIDEKETGDRQYFQDRR